MKRKVTLVLGSGVAWGIAYAGVLRALEELLSVTAGLDTIQIARIFMPTLPHGGIIRNEGVRRFLKDLVGTPDIEDLKHPFFCPAPDVETGEEIVLQEGSLIEAIVASVSIPILFQPNFYRGRYLLDGGLVDPEAEGCAGIGRGHVGNDSYS